MEDSREGQELVGMWTAGQLQLQVVGLNANKNKSAIFLFMLQSDIKVVNLSGSQALSKACVYFHNTLSLVFGQLIPSQVKVSD